MIRLLTCLLLIGLWSCNNSKESAQQAQAETMWMVTQPVQCLGNPWEEAWLLANDQKAAAYPRGEVRIVEAEEAAIIRQFFEEQGITVYAVKGIPFPEGTMVCDACHCPQGYDLYVQVKSADRGTMQEQYGFSPTEAPNE